MFLKSLDIFGFKSFVDRTHIEFADGITALLGPNGCLVFFRQWQIFRILRKVPLQKQRI